MKGQQRGAPRLLSSWAALLLTFAWYWPAAAGAAETPDAWRVPFPRQFGDPAIFSKAIAEAGKTSVSPRVASGITVPHHLVAADLIARAFQMVDASRIDTVVLLFPDHFRRSRLPFATTRRGFETVFGRLEVGQDVVRLLLQSEQLVDESDLFESDHGIGAILPFVRHYIPSARLVPIAVSIRSTKDDWNGLAAILRNSLTPSTLIVQSTDFSHYLPLHEAVRRDQEVLNLLAADELAGVARLPQPSHTDSRGAQYLQMRLQRDIFGARPIVLFNANSQAYTAQPVARTTSYIVQMYEPRPGAIVGRDWPGSKVYCFAGDTFFGRGVLRTLGGAHGEAGRVRREMQRVLNGCRLIVNLTGVMVGELPVNLEPTTLAMPAALTLEWLRALNVVAVSLANNHTMDLGVAAFDEMARSLADAGFSVLKHGSITDLGAFRLTAFTDLDNSTRRVSGVIEDADIGLLARSDARPPLFAMTNWGLDYEATPGRRELHLMEAFQKAAVSLIVGVHPHVAARGFHLLGGGETLSIHSLGNFLFDQSSRRASGSILEVRVFDQGTFFARLVPIPNFLEPQ
jgi:poly-gamma-glutamate synthesis protein (capsule biosynthesis protein)